jgi:hypothetical protein
VPRDEEGPDQRVRATSSRDQTTDARNCSPSVHRVSAAAPLSHDWGTSPNRRLEYEELLPLREFGENQTDDLRLKGCGRRIRRGEIGLANEISKSAVFCDRLDVPSVPVPRRDDADDGSTDAQGRSAMSCISANR